MFGRLARFAKRTWDRLASAALQLFRHVTQPAFANPLSGTLADLPGSRAQLLAEHVFLRQQLAVIHTPYEAPRANAICERFVGSLRRECLDHVLVLGDGQLMRVLREHAGHFNQARPDQGLAQQTPESRRLGQANVPPLQQAAAPSSSIAPGHVAGLKIIAMPVLNRVHHTYMWAT